MKKKQQDEEEEEEECGDLKLVIGFSYRSCLKYKPDDGSRCTRKMLLDYIFIVTAQA